MRVIREMETQWRTNSNYVSPLPNDRHPGCVTNCSTKVDIARPIIRDEMDILDKIDQQSTIAMNKREASVSNLTQSTLDNNSATNNTKVPGNSNRHSGERDVTAMSPTIITSPDIEDNQQSIDPEVDARRFYQKLLKTIFSA